MEVFLWGFTVSPKACVNFPESREESHFLFGLSTIFFDRPDQKLLCDGKVTVMVGADLLRRAGDVPPGCFRVMHPSKVFLIAPSRRGLRTHENARGSRVLPGSAPVEGVVSGIPGTTRKRHFRYLYGIDPVSAIFRTDTAATAARGNVRCEAIVPLPHHGVHVLRGILGGVIKGVGGWMQSLIGRDVPRPAVSGQPGGLPLPSRPRWNLTHF